MAIITDRNDSYMNEYLLSCLGESTFFRKADYIIENPLYRYRPNLKWTLEEIRTGRIHISDMSEQNDPFDSSYAISDEELEREIYPAGTLLKAIRCFDISDDETEILSGMDSDGDISVIEFVKTVSPWIKVPEQRIFARIKYLLGNILRHHGFGYKIACFSERKNSIPMWAYYADRHRGICLEYDVSRLPPESELRQAFCKIHYSEYRPRDRYGEYSLVVKSAQWSHEQEWRLICKTEEDHITVPCLSAVYLGTRFDAAEVDHVVSAIKDSGKEVKLFYCEVDQERYDLQFRQILI